VILLDTHVLVWLQREPRKLSRVAAAAIRRAQTRDELAISAATLVELARLISHGRVKSTGTIESTIRQLVLGVELVAVSVEVATLTAHFPSDFPADPMDRIIAATARAENIALVTADARIRACSLVKTIW
jgi:PIN domain nuclease of toxin-antitoxin system